MDLLILLVVGFFAGLIASAIMKTAYPWWLDVILGIVGAYVGGFLLSLLGIGGGATCVNAYGACGAGWLYELIAGIIGAIVIIAIVHAVRREPMRY